MSDELLCPKCSRPRLEKDLDCPFCGVVYDRVLPLIPELVSEDTARLASDPSWEGLHDVYTGPAPEEETRPVQKYRKIVAALDGSAGAHGEEEIGPGRETLLTRHIGLALVMSALLYLVVQALLGGYLIGGSVHPDEVRARFAAVTGVTPPSDLGDGGAVRFVGRDFIWFTRDSQPVPTTIVVYHRGWLAKDRTQEEMLVEFRGWVDHTGVQWRPLEMRPGRIRGVPVELEIFAYGTEPGNYPAAAALTGFIAADGEPAVLYLMAPWESFERLLRALVG